MANIEDIPHRVLLDLNKLELDALRKGMFGNKSEVFTTEMKWTIVLLKHSGYTYHEISKYFKNKKLSFSDSSIRSCYKRLQIGLFGKDEQQKELDELSEAVIHYYFIKQFRNGKYKNMATIKQNATENNR